MSSLPIIEPLLEKLIPDGGVAAVIGHGVLGVLLPLQGKVANMDEFGRCMHERENPTPYSLLPRKTNCVPDCVGMEICKLLPITYDLRFDRVRGAQNEAWIPSPTVTLCNDDGGLNV